VGEKKKGKTATFIVFALFGGKKKGEGARRTKEGRGGVYNLFFSWEERKKTVPRPARKKKKKKKREKGEGAYPASLTAGKKGKKGKHGP